MKEKGFTLIELLVVIAIIGILAGTLFVAIDPKGQTDKATEKKALAQLAQVNSQAGIIFSDSPDFNFAAVKNDEKITDLTDTVESNEKSWAASVNLPNERKACRDSSGYYGTDKTVIEMAFGVYSCTVGEDNDGGGGGEDKGCSQVKHEDKDLCIDINWCDWNYDKSVCEDNEEKKDCPGVKDKDLCADINVCDWDKDKSTCKDAK